MSAQIDEAEVARIAKGLGVGAKRAILLMSEDWQFAGTSTFNHNGAWAAARTPAAERQNQRDGKWMRTAFRLTPLGLAVRKHLEANHAG